MPLEIRGYEADPDDLMPRDPVSPSEVQDGFHHIPHASDEDMLLHDHMQWFGTASWLRHMPKIAGLRVDGGTDELPIPHWLGGKPPDEIIGAAGVPRTFKDGRERAAARALQRTADAAQVLADKRRYEAAGHAIEALDPNPLLPVVMRSSITAPPPPKFDTEVINPMMPPVAISGQDVNAHFLPPGAMAPLVNVAPRTAWKAADAVMSAARDTLDASGPGAWPRNSDLSLHELAMPPLAVGLATAMPLLCHAPHHHPSHRPSRGSTLPPSCQKPLVTPLRRHSARRTSRCNLASFL